MNNNKKIEEQRQILQEALDKKKSFEERNKLGQFLCLKSEEMR